jgi:hypothetical protein
MKLLWGLLILLLLICIFQNILDTVIEPNTPIEIVSIEIDAEKMKEELAANNVHLEGINNSIKNFMRDRRIPIAQPQVFDGNDPSTLNIKPSIMNSLASSFVNNETQVYEKAVNELVNHVDVINTGFNKINNSFPR